MTPIGAPGFFSAAAPFNPIAAIPWTAAYWTEGPEFVAQGYADAGAVGTWPDEVGSYDATQGTAGNKPTYRASGIGGKPSVEFDGSSDFLENTATAFDLTEPFCVVAVMKFDNPNSNTRGLYYGHGAWVGTAGGQWVMDGYGTGTNDNANNNLLVGIHEASSYQSTIQINGTDNNVNALQAGITDGIVIGKTIMYMTSYYWDGHISFLGVYNGRIWSEGNWPAFKAWVTANYGITIA